MDLKIGDKAPDFKLPTSDGKEFQLYRDQKGKPCILYFYPKDFTHGCTAEACGFRDHFAEFQEFEIDVIGISTDSIETHKEFKEKYRLPFELLSDPDHIAIKLYNAKVPIINLTKRITYLLDKHQEIKAIYKSMLGFKQHTRKMLQEINPDYSSKT